MRPADLHPGPSEGFEDHRETFARQQLDDGHVALTYWRRAVESLAAELQCDPIEAHALLLDGSYEITKGLAWHWWL